MSQTKLISIAGRKTTPGTEKQTGSTEDNAPNSETQAVETTDNSPTPGTVPPTKTETEPQTTEDGE